MSEIHPTDEQLLLFADGGPDAAVEAHVAACPDCRTSVEAARAGRAALRSAPLLELPAARREEILAALPRPERSRWTRRRFVGVAVPLVALAAVVAVVGLSGGSDPERTAEQMAAQDAARAAEDAAEEAPPAALEAAPAQEDAARERVPHSVAGPPEAVAELLRAEGLEATVVDGAVEVRGATAEEVEQALRERPTGEVEIRLVGP